jgi:hypothetical protein
MAAGSYPALNTKRRVIAQVTICSGCCYGNTERGLPAVPVDWLKSEWRKQGLLKRVQLTISGCVGPCDVPNVVVITSDRQQLVRPSKRDSSISQPVGVGVAMQRDGPFAGTS